MIRSTSQPYGYVKRLIDLLGASVLIFVLSPLLFAVALVIRLTLGSPVLFRQLRPGLHGRPFILRKFRTMRDATGLPMSARSDEQRLTVFGRFLRTTSLDELPELLNVVRGDMSLVGPRPLLVEYLPLYTNEQARRHEVRPGMTGWAQVNGRNAISWDEKFALDVWYVDHRSLWLDFRILFMTLWTVIGRKGISHSGEATMPRFTGSSTNA